MKTAILALTLFVAGTLSAQTATQTRADWHCETSADGTNSSCSYGDPKPQDDGIHIRIHIRTQAQPPEPQPLLAYPAVQEEYGNLGGEFCDMGACQWSDDPDGKIFSPPHRRTRWTCTNKSAVLFTSEDGNHLCVIFPKAPTEAK